MSKLLPCPHCGEANEIYRAMRGLGGGEPYAIDCVGCGYEFVPRAGFDVVEMWNRRTPAYTEADALAAALREMVKAFSSVRLRVPGPNANPEAFERWDRQMGAINAAKALLK